ncbi:uncharacterized protein LOC130810028 [Amaranthus tricolor]|uniref:uncharacterized protein LOC130810028 n=1 Tax=Amaranthus tricolor TaxID=29722 RepID=UPI00258CF3C2|nr:uncharacterized protein LOC130810028 [Amaranthus tricolor]
MPIFCLQHPSRSAKRCKLFFSVLKDPFSSCHSCYPSHMSCSNPEDEEVSVADFQDVQELVVSMIRTRAMEAKFRRKGSLLSTESYSFIHPTSGELFVSTAKQHTHDDHSAQKHKNSKNKEEMDDFVSVHSHFSSPCFTTAVDGCDTFFSMRTNFSHCSSMNDPDSAENRWWVSEAMDSSELKRRAIIQELCHCEGWPFGLCRRALLLPPLPKSPSESWSWCKGFPKHVKTV